MENIILIETQNLQKWSIIKHKTWSIIMQPTITMLFYTKPKAVHIILEVYANALCFGNLAL